MNDWLNDLDGGDLEMFLRLLEKANPPPILHRYRGAADWTIKEIAAAEVHVTSVEAMNDPFEYAAPMTINSELLRRVFEIHCRVERQMDNDAVAREMEFATDASIRLILERIIAEARKSGVVCFSANPRSNRMWGYYASSHRGVCIGYDTQFDPFCFSFQVLYEDPKEPLEVVDALLTDSTKFCDHLARRKGKEWEYEQEYRIPVGPIPDGHTRLLPFDPRAISEIRLGVKIESDFKVKVLEAARKLPVHPRIIQMECDYDRFELVENIVDS